VLTLIAAIYFITSRLILFDPKMKLMEKDSSFIVNEMRKIQALKKLDLSNTIVHFTSNNCSCTKYSEEHKTSIDNQAKLDGFNVVNITLSNNLLSIIPSTPSILIIDNLEKLLYFGPYSVGLSCTQSNGYVETVLQNYAIGFNSDLIINDVKGCYCNI